MKLGAPTVLEAALPGGVIPQLGRHISCTIDSYIDFCSDCGEVCTFQDVVPNRRAPEYSNYCWTCWTCDLAREGTEDLSDEEMSCSESDSDSDFWSGNEHITIARGISDP